jgi:hypothetical protein
VVLLAPLAQAGPFALKDAFGHNVTLTQTSNVSIVEYCPDNTCDRFELRGADSLALLHDFVYLYLYLHGTYIYLEEFKAQGPNQRLASIIQRRKGSCGGVDERAIADCIVTRIARRSEVKYFFVRYDEGYRCIGRENLFGPPAPGKTRCTKVRGAP